MTKVLGDLIDACQVVPFYKVITFAQIQDRGLQLTAISAMTSSVRNALSPWFPSNRWFSGEFTLCQVFDIISGARPYKVY